MKSIVSRLTLLAVFAFLGLTLIFARPAFANGAVCRAASFDGTQDLGALATNINASNPQADCDKYFEANPEAKQFAADPKQSLASKTLDVLQFNQHCAKGVGGAWVDWGKDIYDSLVKAKDAISTRVADNNEKTKVLLEFQKNCDDDQTLDCKRKLIAAKGELFAKRFNDQQLKSYSTAEIQSLATKFDRGETQRDLLRKQAEWDALSPEEKKKRFDDGQKKTQEAGQKALNELESAVAAKLKKLGIQYNCYSIPKKIELACHAIGSIVTPDLVAGPLISAKLVQIAGVRALKTAVAETALVSKELQAANAAQRLTQAETLIGRQLSEAEKNALLRAHEVGANELGRDGTKAGIGNYTDAQLRQKAELLKEAGFNETERRALIEKGIVGYERNVVDLPKNVETPYVSYVNENGDRIAARIVERDPAGATIIERLNPDGSVVREKLSSAQVETLRDSHTARLALERTGDTRVDAFRDSYRNGDFSGNNQFISFQDKASGDRLGARVIGLDKDGSLLVEVPSANGERTVRSLTREDLATVRQSETAALAYQKNPPAPPPPVPDQIYEFKSKKISDYTTRGGQTVEVNFNSPTLQTTMKDAIKTYENAGVKTIPNGKVPTPAELEKVSNAWLNYAKKIESKEDFSVYGAKRDQIIKQGNNVGDLGHIATCEAAVCRELSIFGSVSFAEMGITSRVVKGNINGGGHAWIEFINPKNGEVIGLVDSNYTRKFYHNWQEYYREVGARPIDLTTVAAPR